LTPRLKISIHRAIASIRKTTLCSTGAKQRVAPLTLRLPDNRMLSPRRNVIVGDVSKKSYFASTIGAVSEQPIAKYIDSQGT